MGILVVLDGVEVGNESNRSIAGMNDSFAFARITFVLRASKVRPLTGVTKTDTFWPLSRDLNFVESTWDLDVPYCRILN